MCATDPISVVESALTANNARSSIKPLRSEARGLGGHQKAYHCEKADKQGDNQVQPLESKPGSPDGIRGPVLRPDI